jgi:hypothetical protein
MSDTNQKVIIILAAFFLFIVLLFGWPTPYRYVVLHRSLGCGDGGCTVVVRINRVTGSTQWSDGQHGWRSEGQVGADPWAHAFDQPKKD